MIELPPAELSPPMSRGELILTYVVRCGFTGGLGYLIGSLPNPWNIVLMTLFVLVVVVVIAVTFWQVRPRPCEMCGATPAFPNPIDPTVARRRLRWWDPRLPDVKNTQWLCLPHGFDLFRIQFGLPPAP
jgi:hypothetical protein